MRGDRRKRLSVPLRPQLTHCWCWVASVQMVLEYLGTRVEQRTLAGDDGRDASVAERFLRTGEPAEPLRRFGFTFERTDMLAALSWAQVRREIDAERPFICGWNLPDGVHYMVGTGYEIVGGKRYVLANNPLPLGAGARARVASLLDTKGRMGRSVVVERGVARTGFPIRPAYVTAICR